MEAPTDKAPQVVGNALIDRHGNTYQLRLLDRLYLACHIVTPADLERAYASAPNEPTQGP